jgi:hypothetical protein
VIIIDILSKNKLLLKQGANCIDPVFSGNVDISVKKNKVEYIKMVSNISIIEFRERLVKNTKYGNPKIKGTPFAVFSISGELNKSFYVCYISFFLNDFFS